MLPPYVKLPNQSTSPEFMLDHITRYIHSDGSMSTFPKNGELIQFGSREYEITVKDDFTFARKIYYFDLEKLPPMVEGKVYIVSKIVANLLAGHRDDFAYPGTHPDFDGAKIVNDKMIAVKRFRLPDALRLKQDE